MVTLNWKENLAIHSILGQLLPYCKMMGVGWGMKDRVGGAGKGIYQFQVAYESTETHTVISCLRNADLFSMLLSCAFEGG
jgi:hypothetical protein